MKVCIVTGGSGGHIYPALTFTEYLLENDLAEVFFIGNEHRMEARIIPQLGYKFLPIRNDGLQGSFFDKILAILSQMKAILKSRKYLKEEKPDIVFAFGGYVTLPVVLAAKSLNIKIALHEQNAFVGKANKWVSRYAQAIFTCYEDAFKGEPNAYLYGNPRASLAQNVEIDPSEFNRIGLDPDKKQVLVVMGSQGSDSLNNLFKHNISLFEDIDYELIFVTGPMELEAFMDNIGPIPKNVFIQGFVDQGKLLPYLKLIVARAGASTITEIAAFGLPSILIPSPFVANNHQYYNAKALYDKNATILFEEKDLNPESFKNIIDSILHDEARMDALSKNVSAFDTPKVNDHIYAKIKEVVFNEQAK